MKIDHRDRQPLVQKRKPRTGGKQAGEDSIRDRCKREGVKVSAETIRTRMMNWGMTFEEAVAHVPEDRSTIGRKGRKSSPWNQTVKAGIEEAQRRDK